MKRKKRKAKRRKHGEQAWAVFAGSTIRNASGKPFEQKIIIPVTVHRRDSKQCVCRDIDGERLVVPTNEVFPTMEAAADWVRGGELMPMFNLIANDFDDEFASFSRIVNEPASITNADAERIFGDHLFKCDELIEHELHERGLWERFLAGQVDCPITPKMWMLPDKGDLFIGFDGFDDEKDNGFVWYRFEEGSRELDVLHQRFEQDGAWCC